MKKPPSKPGKRAGKPSPEPAIPPRFGAEQSLREIHEALEGRELKNAEGMYAFHS